MTRINVIPPNELCDQHLLAEHRELTRIPNFIVKKKGNVNLSNEISYILGKNHVKFFRDKLLFLYRRYRDLHTECINRGMNVTYKWPEEAKQYTLLWNDYDVTYNDIYLNIKRILERMPSKPRYTEIKLIY